MMFATIKSYLYAGGIAAIAILAGLAKYFQAKSARQKKRADHAEGALKRKDKFDAVEAEIDAEYSDRERAAEQDKADGKVPRHLGSSNDW